MDGLINVGIGTEEYFADRDACATATTSYYAFPDGGYAEWAYAEIRFNPDDDRCIFRDDSRGSTMAHEIGHRARVVSRLRPGGAHVQSVRV